MVVWTASWLQVPLCVGYRYWSDTKVWLCGQPHGCKSLSVLGIGIGQTLKYGCVENVQQHVSLNNCCCEWAGKLCFSVSFLVHLQTGN